MRSGAATSCWHVAALVVLACTLALPGDPVAAAPTGAAACTDPPPNGLDAARPDQLRERYHLDQLFAHDHDGRGQIGVILEFGQSVDLVALDNWGTCLRHVHHLPAAGATQGFSEDFTSGGRGLHVLPPSIVRGLEGRVGQPISTLRP
jgi:hypothetical protein